MFSGALIFQGYGPPATIEYLRTHGLHSVPNSIKLLLGIPFSMEQEAFFFARAPFGPGGLVAECIEP